ncbi:MAG: hypothetical protein ACREMY_23710 [bacterium]
MSAEFNTRPLEPPFGQLERSLIDEFVRAKGYDPAALATLTDDERGKLLTDASIYASGKLMEVEARSHFLDEMHGGAPEMHKLGIE